MRRLNLPSGLAILILSGMAVLTALSPAKPVHAVDNDPGPPQTLNCGDPGSRDLCIECDNGGGDGGKIACCDYDAQGQPTCPIVNEPPTTAFTGPNLNIKSATGGLKVAFERKVTVKGGQAYLHFKLKHSLVTANVKKSVSIKGTFTGPDASVGSLAYAVAYLGMGDAALGVLEAQGKSLSLTISGTSRSCQASFSPAECAALAIQLSKLIEGALPPGNGVERAGFLQSVQPLGYQPCQIFC